MENHLIPGLGSLRLAKLRPAHIQELHATSLKSGRLDGKPGGLSPTTVVQHHRVLSEALSHAAKWDLVPRNAAKSVDPPTKAKPAIRTLDHDEIRRFLDAATDSIYYPLFYLALHTGLRRSELSGLQWRETNLDLAQISVTRTLHRTRYGRTLIEQPKTAKGRRLVDLTPTSAIMLREHQRLHEEKARVLGLSWSAEWLVFSYPDGSPFVPDRVSKAFLTLTRKAGIKGVNLRMLRHTHATLLLEQGGPSEGRPRAIRPC